MSILFNNNISRKVKRHKTILTFVVFLALLLFILSSDLSSDLYFINFGPVEDVSCHYSVGDDALETIDENFSPASNAIFFHETSCRSGLDSRQACAVESAARAHPTREIYVLFSAPVNKIRLQDINIELLKNFKNIKFFRVHLLEYAKGTPVETLVAEGALNRTRYPVSHSSAVLRFLTLYKWGGVCLDLDTVVAKPLDGLPKNWAAREDDYVSSSALAFYRDHVGRLFADSALRDLSKRFRGDVRWQSGPLLITRVLKEICSTSDVTAMSADTCKGFEVFGSELVLPLGANPEFFQPVDLRIQDAYIYRVGSPAGNLVVQSDSPFAKLAKRHCPVVYETYRQSFGI